MDYVEKKAEVCVPTFQTDCEREDVKNGLVIKQQEECYQVSSNLSTWPSRLNQNDITLIMKRTYHATKKPSNKYLYFS